MTTLPREVPLTRDNLTEIFRSSERRDGVQLIGIEHEKISFKTADGGYVPYAGKGGIMEFLLQMCTRFGWEPLYTEGFLLSLQRDHAQITLEPGGQIELSGAPQRTIADVKHELAVHFREVREVGDALGIGLAGIGMHPARDPFDVPFIPKPRYRVMREFFQRSGQRGLYMMGATATVQVNLDFRSEAEALEKMRAGQLASPYVAAMFGNSPFERGTLTDWESRRYFTWTDVDPARQGLLPFVHARDDLYQRYATWAMGAAMFGIHRGEHEFIAAPPMSFRQFIDTGLGRERATTDDWLDHLGTLYPEVRLKKTIELRGADTGSLDHSVAVAAIWRGLLDDPATRRRVIAWLEPPAHPVAWQLSIAKDGLRVPQVAEVAGELLRLAAGGLFALSEPSGASALQPAQVAVEEAMSPATWLRRKFKNSSKINGLDVLLATRI